MTLDQPPVVGPGPSHSGTGGGAQTPMVKNAFRFPAEPALSLPKDLESEPWDRRPQVQTNPPRCPSQKAPISRPFLPSFYRFGSSSRESLFG